MASAKPAFKRFALKTDPFNHQRKGLEKTANMIYCGYFMEQGTGKTKLAIDRSVHIFLQRKIDGNIIICPKSLMETWMEELETHCALPYVSAKWDPDLRVKSVKQMEKVLYCNDPEIIPFLIMNIEALRTKKGAKIAHWYSAHKRLHAIVDESSKIKTPSAAQTVAAINFARTCKARTVMSGTPVSNSPADYYSQLNFLMPNPLGFSNFYSFRARYCELETKVVPLPKPVKKKGKWVKTRKIQQITGPKNSDELKKKLIPFCVFVKKKDCLDLPDKIYHKRFCELTKQGKRIYADLKKQIITEIDSSDERYLTIEYHLPRLLRLQQLTGGFLPSDDDPNAEQVPGGNPKLDLLVETIETFPGPTLIWARFQAEHFAIYKALSSVVGDKRIGFITGPADKDLREEYRKRFQQPNDPLDYLICTQSCAGYGYTLTAAENEVYYSNTFSYEHREQSEDRAHRIGQTKHVNIIDLLVSDSVDLKVFQALQTKRDVANLLTDVSDIEEMM